MSLRQPLFAVGARSRASALLLLAGLVMATTATTLVAVVPMYADAIERAGFERTLEDAPAVDRSAVATARVPAASVTGADERIESAVEARLPGDYRTLAFATTREFRLAAERFDGDLIASLAVVRGDDLWETVDGDPAASADGDRLAVSLHEAAATLLGVGIGDSLRLDGRADGIVDVEIVALLRPLDVLDDRWLDRPELRDGVGSIGASTTVGPFLLTDVDFASLGLTTSFTWRGVLDPASVTRDDVASLRSAARGFDSVVDAVLDEFDPDVATGLPRLLGATDTALASSGAVIAVVLLQIVGLALYGLGLAASVLSGSRLVETALLRSRGATTRQLGALAATEALLVALPAAAAGPFLAQRVVALLGRWGPVATAGLDLSPEIDRTAIVGVGIVALVSVGVIAFPAVRSAQALADATGQRSRRTRPDVLQRSGADIVVAVLALLGLWQLTRSSAATRDLAGRLGTDPVLVLAPTLGVLAASLLTLRLISLFARAVQTRASAGTGLGTALAGWELARRPARTARTSVLVVMAVTIGTFAAVQGASWERSQRDQADARVGADLLVEPGLAQAAGVASRDQVEAYLAVGGVDAASPVDRPTAAITAGLGNITTVAVDGRTVGDVLRIRPDLLSGTDPAALRAPVGLDPVPLGAGGDLEVAITVDRNASTAGDVLSTAVYVVDRYGTIHRVDARSVVELGAAGTVTAVLSFPLADMAGPLGLIRMDITVPIVNAAPAGPDDDPPPTTSFDIRIGPATIGGETIDLTEDTWSLGPLASNNNTVVPASATTGSIGDALQVRLDSGASEQVRARLTASLLTSTADDGTVGLADEGIVVPAFVTGALAAELELGVGDSAVGRVAGAAVTLRIDGIVDAVPFATAEPLAMLVDWPTLVAARYTTTGRFDPPEQWALAVSSNDADRAVATEFTGATVTSRREVAADLADDPLAVGLFGSLALALAGSLLVAVVGLLLTAVVGARERRASYSVLRAMGTPTRTLRRWLLLEVVPLVALSALAGLVAGVLLAQAAVDALTVTAEGISAVPSPTLVVPWVGVAVVVAVAVGAGIVVPLLTGRLLGRSNTADDLRIGDSS